MAKKEFSVTIISLQLYHQGHTDPSMTAINQELVNKLEILAKASMDGYWVLDNTGQVIFANQIIGDMYGYSPEELTGRHLREFEAVEDEAAMQSHIARIMAKGHDRFETRHCRKDGTVFDVEVSTIFISEDEIFIAFTRNISERKRAEEQLWKEKAFLRSLIDSTSDLIYFKDYNGIYIGCNKASEKFIGLSEHEQIGKSDYDLLAPEIAETSRRHDQMVMEGGVSIRYEEQVTTPRTGTLILETVKAPILASDGHPIGLVGISRDISERKNIEEQLKRSEEKFRTITALSPDIVSIIAEDGSLSYNSPAAFPIHGYTDAEMQGRNTFELIHPADQPRVTEAFNALLSHPEESMTVQYRYRHNNGGYTWMEATARNHLHNPLIRGIVTISRDITSRKEQEEQRLDMERQLLHLQKIESLGVLAGGIAHDFNNILTGIIGNISFARRYLDESHKAWTILQNAEKAANRASELSNQLLTFAKGGQPIKKVVPVKHIIDECISLVLRGSNVSYQLELPDDALLIEVDEGQICQAINNIIINATQAMPGGGMITTRAERVEIDDSCEIPLPPGRYIRLSFTDSGCGIPDDDQLKIFDPYFTTKAGGNGLGLATTYSIVNKHGGRISVHSVVGTGSTFEILLPACDVTAEPFDTVPSSQDFDTRHNVSVLVMDDEEIIRDMARFMLNDLGYQVQTCIGGEEALALYASTMDAGRPYSVVILDLTIPGGMGGRETAGKLLAIDPDARLIVSSGYSNDPVMSEFPRYGFRAVLKKPYDSDAISSVLDTVLSAG